MRISSLSRQPRSQNGFTYLWMLLLVALMGIALTAVAQVHTTIVQRDKEQALLMMGRQFQTAIGRYYESQVNAGKKEYPASLDDLLLDPRFPGVKRHLRQVFVDPMTGKAEWGLLRVGGRIVGVYSLSEQTPIKQANFEATIGHFAGAKKYSDWVFSYPADLTVKFPTNSTDTQQVPERSTMKVNP